MSPDLMGFETLLAITGEIAAAAPHVSDEQAAQLAEAIRAADNIVVGGAGRSGLAARGLANRLLHLGFSVGFIGEPTTRPISGGDLLVAISGSGRTASLRAAAEKSKALGAAVATITLDPHGPVAELADVVVVLPGTTRLAREDAASGAPESDSIPTPAIASAQPVGSLFEQLAWLVCDAVVMDLRDRTGQSNDDLLARHANLE